MLSGCARLDTIPYAPRLTPEQFLAAQPHWCVQLPGLDFILIQPSSTVMVYAVGLLGIGAGYYFLRIRGAHRARFWWGAGLLLSGLGALLAGTSYQAFGYEIKCAGRAFCTWTSWWEVAYLLCTAAGMGALLAGVAFATTSGFLRRAACAFALLSAGCYAAAVLAGALIPVRFLVSFECLVLAAAPAAALALLLSARTPGGVMAGRALLKTWLGLILVIVAYGVALGAGLGPKLWAAGIWFTENDVLHLGMIAWIVYVVWALPARLQDMPKTPDAPAIQATAPRTRPA